MIRLLLIMVLVFAALPAAAQDDTSIPSCDEETLAEIETQLDTSLRQLNLTLTTLHEGMTIGEYVIEVESDQITYWNWVDTLPSCAEKYTIAYEVGRAFDHYLAAVSIQASVVFANERGDDDLVDELNRKIERQLRRANNLLQRKTPELYEELFAAS